MLLAIFPLIVSVIGALLYALSANPKVSELGRLSYFAGLVSLSFALASHVVKIG